MSDGARRPGASRARRGVPKLAAHLSDAYGTEVTEIAQLDLGVYRVDRADGPSWVARLFPAVRPRDRVEGDAEILRWLAEASIRPSASPPPSPSRCSRVSRCSSPSTCPRCPRYERRTAIVAAGGLRVLGWLLGRLHTLAGRARRAPAAPGITSPTATRGLRSARCRASSTEAGGSITAPRPSPL